MLETAPRPLPRQRLERLLHGLQQRMSRGAQRVSAEIELLREQAKAAERKQAEARELMLTDFARRLEDGTTQWDEMLHSRWSDAELRSFKAVFETADREGDARREAKKMIEYTTVEAKKRIADIEKRFLRAKDVPIKRLNNFRAATTTAREEIASVEAATEAALAQRSLRIPNVEMAPIPWDTPANSNAAFEQLKESNAHARQLCHRLAEQPLSKFLESGWWWGLCLLVFVAVSCVLYFSQVLLIWSLTVGLVVTVLFVLGGIVGIHPWLKRTARAEVPKIRSQLVHCLRLADAGQQLAIEENDLALKRLAAKRDERALQAKQWYDTQIQEISKQLESKLQQLRAHAYEQKRLASDYLTTSMADTNRQYENRMELERQQHVEALRALQAGLDEQAASLNAQINGLSQGGALRLQAGTQKAIQIFSRSRRWCHAHFPLWEQLQAELQHWPEPLQAPILPVGTVSIDSLVPSALKRDAGQTQLVAPLLFSPLQDEYLTITGDPTQPSIQQLIRNLVMRSLTSLPAGKTQVCVIDPPGLGRDFGWLMHLSDFDPGLVSHRVWTQPAHIAKQLQSLALAAEDFIQQSLRNQYQNIVQYNQDAGALAEPFRLLVWSSFPSGLDDQSWKSLQSLLDTGSRCGIIPILIIDPAVGWPSPGQAELVRRRGLHLTLSPDGKAFVAQSHAIGEVTIEPYPAAPESQSQEIIKEVGRRALLGNRVEVPLERMVPPPGQRWQADSSQCLEIPIGQSGVGRTHSLKLGIGTAQHAIIAGKTGSGKSSLLHALLTSALLKYSPDRLRLVLLDFKKGVEFQVYADSVIPHADIIGIESQREFGLSALEYIDGCMQRRGEAFRQVGVQDVASWNLLHPKQPMPRMLLVIDEFQELFVEDDKLSSQASLILDRIVRQGRSFGVHAVLSSQTLAGAYSLPRTTLGQMAVRIALQCDPSDAQIIFADDNPAASRLKFPGQAVYNDAGGRIEGNQPMQIGWLAKSQQQEWFKELPAGYRNQDVTTNLLGRTVVYDGNRPATWQPMNAELAIAQAARNVNPDAIWCVVGESVAINPAVTFPLTQQTGRNVLIVGADDPQAAAVINAIAASFLRGTHQRSPQLICIQGAKPTDTQTLKLGAQWQHLHAELKLVDNRGTDALLKEVHELLQLRIDGADSPEPMSPILLSLLQIGRLRSLRRDDDFASFGETQLTPDKQLEEILRDGPSHGIHTLLWAESYSTVNRWLSRTALREIEIRILMQMSGNDSTNLIDSLAASRLGEHVMLVLDEATGQEQKFRPFACDSLAALSSWSGGLDEN